MGVQAYFSAYDVGELFARPRQEPIWFAKPFVAQDCITDIVGQSKWGGKSTFALQMCKAICRGEPFLGQPTIKTPVLYLTEERATTFVAALKRAGFTKSDPFHTVFWDETVSMLGEELDDGTIKRDTRTKGEQRWEKVLARACEIAHNEVKAKLIVLDTFGQFAMLDNENDSGEMYKYVTKLQQIAHHNFSLLVLRHERKAGGKPGTAGRGSTAFAAIADIMATVKKGTGSTATKQTIQMQSRFMDVTPEKMVIELTQSGYTLNYADFITIKETSSDLPEDTKGRLDLEVLKLISDKGITANRLAAELSVKFETAKRKLERLLAGKQVTYRGSGKRGDPRFYFKNISNEQESSKKPAKLPGSADDLIEDSEDEKAA